MPRAKTPTMHRSAAISSYEPFAATDRPARLPAGYDVCIAALSPGYQAAITDAMKQGFLDGVQVDGQWFVSRYDLEDLAGPGSDTSDPDGGCFI